MDLRPIDEHSTNLQHQAGSSDCPIRRLCGRVWKPIDEFQGRAEAAGVETPLLRASSNAGRVERMAAQDPVLIMAERDAYATDRSGWQPTRTRRNRSCA